MRLSSGATRTPGLSAQAGAIEPCDSGREILPFLRKVLETNKSDYWVPDDPDIVLAIYTDDDVPFLPPKWTLLWEKSELTAERETRDAMRAKCGPLPDDLVEMILFVDAYNFAGAGLYYGDGVCFKLRPTRACLQKFYNELRGEYAALRARHGVSATDRDDF